MRLTFTKGAPSAVDDFLETLPPDLSGGTQLVLIDGKPSYLDPSKIPPGMIASIEVSREGSMPQYGAYSTGRIINIKLKKNFRGVESGSKLSGAFEGGGFQDRVRFSGGETHGKLLDWSEKRSPFAPSKAW